MHPTDRLLLLCLYNLYILFIFLFTTYLHAAPARLPLPAGMLSGKHNRT